MMLCLIVAGNRTNELVEEHFGDLNWSLLEEENLPKVPESFGYKCKDYVNSSVDSANSEGDEEDDNETSHKEAEAERLIM